MSKYFILCLSLLLCVSVWAADANEFLIGAYSTYQIRYAGSNYNTKFESLGGYLNNAGYNATVYSLNSEVNDFTDRLTVIFQKLHESGIKSMLHDNTWLPNQGRLGVGSTTFGNRLQIEAEYQFKTEIVNGESVFVVDSLYTNNQASCLESYNYVTKHETGSLINENNTTYIFSNDFAWVCDSSQGHTPGIALSYPRKRWKPHWTSWPSFLCYDIAFFNEAINDNKLYISVALRYEDISNGMPVADISLKLYIPPNPVKFTEYDRTIPRNYINIPLTPTNPIYSTSIVAQSFPSSMQDEFGNYYFEYYVDLSTLTSYMSGSSTSSTRGFYHINPEIYWHGNGKLIIDYITIEDDINRSVRSEQSSSPYFTKIDTQLNTLSGCDINNNLLYFLSMDEPCAGQLQMYKLMQNHLNGLNPPRKMVTATWLRDRGIRKHDNTPYNYHKRFLHEANPDRIMVDIYPLLGNIAWEGNQNGSQSVQSIIDTWIHYYYFKLVKTIQQSNNPDTEILHVPQTFGIVLQDTGQWSYNMPPRSMVKVMKFLPLCYASDGIVDFCIAFRPEKISEGGKWVTPLSYDIQYNNLRITDHVSSYDYLASANRKIAKYGPIIKGLTWLTANKIMTSGISTTPALNNEDSILLSSVGLNSIDVVASTDSTGYDGNVQCGYYSDGANPYFMLVNRRAVYEKSNIDHIPLKHVDLRFEDAAPQTVCFEPDSQSHGVFGTHVALYDPYDDQIYKTISGVIDVEMGPGDGKLLQMCSTLPTLVTNDADIKNIAYLSGSITIDQGAEVTIHPETTTKIIGNSTIRVKGGSTLNISGMVEIADSVSIIVESGSDIIFNNATCNWGINSILQVENSGITATNTVLQNTTSGNVWRGLRITNAGSVSMTSSTITGAQSNEVTNSQVLLTDCRFNVPTNGMGLSVVNTLPSQNVRITSTTGNMGFYSTGANNMGLFYDNPNASLFIDSIVFDGFFAGFANGRASAVGDTIQYCYFSNNTTGIHLAGLQYSPLIRNCTFFQNDLGACFEVSSPKVLECDFVSCDVGIRTELATATTGGIYNSNFSWGETGIVSRGSNQRVSDNKFYTNTGILNHSGSILNMGNSANNLFEAEHENLKFQDTATYNARVQLYEGHNDFYHKHPGPINPSIDLHFDSNWYVVPPPRSNAINASYNWFEDSTIKISCPSTPSHYAFCNFYDPSPNVNLDNNDRMAQALSAELAGNYQIANDTYKTILNENVVGESDLLYDALDAYYRTANLAGVTLTENESYLLAKITQYETVNPTLNKYLQDYLVKNCLQAEAFQTAIDLLELRIINAESSIDSLHAVMDLENVLQLIAMSESKKTYQHQLHTV